jgi:hypothetical protein
MAEKLATSRPRPIFDNTDLYQQNSKDAVSLFIISVKEKAAKNSHTWALSWAEKY